MSEERIITAAVVTTGGKGDGPELPRLLAISQQNGMEVDTIIGDAAYSGKDNLQLAKEQNIDIIAKLNPAVSQGCRKQGEHFHYNKDAEESDYYGRKSKERYKIEAKNSELKNVHGYGRADSYGIENMEMQGAMAIFTVNLKRILKLI